MSISEFCQKIVILATEFRISCVSWGRTPKRNKEKGGMDTSFHLAWLAVDLIPDDPADTPKIITRGQRLGLKMIDEMKKKGHIHAQII